ncbi:MAG: hypothetical protein IKN38_07280, partial [Clostridia bacterium]|nr:hypothetical protein [Clostridia bacterium]
MKMKIAALILACLMIVPFIASCGQKNEGAGRNTDVQTTDASTGGDETEDDSVTASQAEIKEIMDYVNSLNEAAE